MFCRGNREAQRTEVASAGLYGKVAHRFVGESGSGRAPGVQAD